MPVSLFITKGYNSPVDPYVNRQTYFPANLGQQLIFYLMVMRRGYTWAQEEKGK